MTHSLASPPSFGRIVSEQFSLLVRGLRLEAVLIFSLLVLASIAIAFGYLDAGSPMDFATVPVVLMYVAGFALPFSIWHQTRRSDPPTSSPSLSNVMITWSPGPWRAGFGR